MEMKTLSKILVILLMTATLFAWDGFNYVKTSESESGILLQWQARSEKDLSYYIVYRSRSDSDVFTRLGYVTPQGNGASYIYNDNDIFSKSAASADFKFNYKVRAVLKNGRFDDSPMVEASLASLSVRRQTWGSIKAMFR
jgi:hypothetical protein